MILDIEFNDPNNNDGCFSLITSSSNVNIDVNIWHSKLGHIGKEIINRLARCSITLSSLRHMWSIGCEG